MSSEKSSEAANISCYDIIHHFDVFMSTLESTMFMTFIVLLLFLKSLPKTVSVMEHETSDLLNLCSL